MDRLIATATGLGLAAGLVAVYAVECWLWPFGHCRRCEGTGRRGAPDNRHFGLCRRCKGTGRRLRIGRRIFNWLRRLHA